MVMAIEDRQCQIEAAQRSVELLHAGKNPLIQARTGFGKTETAFIAAHMGGYHRILWLVPGDVLLEQTATRAEGAGFGSTYTWKPRSPWPWGVDIMVVTPQTAWNRWRSGLMQNGDGPDLIVVDEAHHAYTSIDPRDKVPQVAKLVQEMKKPTLGLTATPWRLSHRQGFNELFDEMVNTPSMKELVKLNYLAPLRLVVPADDANRVHGGGVQSGEYTAKGIESKNSEQIYTKRAISMLADEQHGLAPAEWKQTILYAVSLGHAVKLANLLAERGVPTGFISSRAVAADEDKLHSEVEGDRRLAVESFKDGELRVVVNYAIVTEGFDLASAEIVVVTRPTLSLALYRQMCGRAARWLKGKLEGVVIDCTDNWARFGGPMSYDVFDLFPREDKFVLGEKEFIITCNRPAKKDEHGNQIICGAVIPNAKVQICPACEHKQGLKCDRCGTFRRSENFAFRAVRKSPLANTCGMCIEDEKEKKAAAPLADDASVAERLYAMMEQTGKAKTGQDGPGSRWGKGPRGSNESYGVREKRSHPNATATKGAWSPWARRGDQWFGGRQTFAVRENALIHLVETLEENQMMPDVGQPVPAAPTPEPPIVAKTGRPRPARLQRVARPNAAMLKGWRPSTGGMRGSEPAPEAEAEGR